MVEGKVFVSSVLGVETEDLRAERQVVREVISSFGFLHSWMFEHEPASTDPLDESYLRNVDDCDLFILLVGAKSTEPVARECIRAINQSRPILLFAKKVEDRSAQAELLLKTPGSKYDTFDSPENLRQKVRTAVAQTLVKGLRALHEGSSRLSVIGQLQELAVKLTMVQVKPTIPRRAEMELFQLRKVETDVVVVAKLSSEQEVRIPTKKVDDLLLFGSYGNSEPPALILDGRLQWITPTESWRFFRDPPKPDCLFGFPKPSSLEDPRAKILCNKIRERGWQPGWASERGLTDQLGESYEIVYDEDGLYFRIEDIPSSLILIRKLPNP